MIKLVLGLGNIGDEYAGTRHNVGFEVVAQIAQTLAASARPSKREYDWAVSERAGREIVIARPRLYMNRSGPAARALLQQTDMAPSEMLVVVDDYNLPLGALRFRRRGSDGGHNGLASLIESLETDDFPRLRLGIGPVPDPTETVDFVLSPFAENEREAARAMIDAAAKAVLFAIEHRFEEAMSTYNTTPALPDNH